MLNNKKKSKTTKGIKDEKVNTIAMEILSQFVEAAPTLVREFILNEVEQKINSKSSGSNGNNTNFKQLPSTSVSSSHVSISNNFILSSTSSSSSSLAQTPTSSSSCSKEEAQLQIQTEQTLTNQFDTSTLVLSQSLNTDDVFEPVLINFIIRQMINDPDPGKNYFEEKILF